MVQLIYVGEGQCPSRGELIDLVLSLGVRVADLFAVIHPGGSAEFDVSFMSLVTMELFILNY